MSSLTYCYYRFLVSRTIKSYFFLNVAEIYLPKIRLTRTSFFGTPPVNIFIQIVALLQSGRSFASKVAKVKLKICNVDPSDPSTVDSAEGTRGPQPWILRLTGSYLRRTFNHFGQEGRPPLFSREARKNSTMKNSEPFYLYNYIFGFVRNLTS